VHAPSHEMLRVVDPTLPSCARGKRRGCVFLSPGFRDVFPFRSHVIGNTCVSILLPHLPPSLRLGCKPPAPRSPVHTCASTCASHVASELVDSHPAHSTSTRTLLCGHPIPVYVPFHHRWEPHTLRRPPRHCLSYIRRVVSDASSALRQGPNMTYDCPPQNAFAAHYHPPLLRRARGPFKFERSSTRATSRESVPREKRQDLHNSGL
jgi:hypothetical protein